MSKRIISLVVAAALTSACAADSATAPTAGSSASAAVSGSGSAGTTTTGRVIIEVPLLPVTGSTFPQAHGEAKWDARDSRRREIEFEIEDMRSDVRVSFFVDGVQYGAAQTVDALGYARVELSTQLGQPVPESVKGRRVEVRTDDGAVILAGTF